MSFVDPITVTVTTVDREGVVKGLNECKVMGLNSVIATNSRNPITETCYWPGKANSFKDGHIWPKYSLKIS